MTSLFFFIIITLILSFTQYSWSFTSRTFLRSPLLLSSHHHHHHPCYVLSAVKIDGYDDAFEIIDKYAVLGEPSDDEDEDDRKKLYEAVRFIEVNGYKIYSTIQDKEELWNMAHGSWKLQLSTGSPKNKFFHRPPSFLPPFQFAMISDNHFGNGIGKNEKTIYLALLHNHYWNAKIRQMVVTPADMYLFGKKINFPNFMKRALSLGKKPDDFVDQKPPTFVIVGVSEKALIARGNQSGGLAIWTRLPQDICEVAYKDDNNSRRERKSSDRAQTAF